MTYIDLALLILLGSFILSGFIGGFIYSFGSFLGIIIGTFVAGRFYEPLAELIGSGQGWANIVAFAIIALVVGQFIGIIFHIINKALKLLIMFPFLAIINKVGGIIFGFFEGILFLGISIFFISKFELTDTFIETLGDSQLFPILANIGKALSFLLPRVIREINSII